MNKQELMSDVASNFHEIDSSITQMELELLPALLERRSSLMARLLECITVEDDGESKAAEWIRRVREENFRLELRIGDRLGRMRAEMKRLCDVSRRTDVYAEERYRSAPGSRPAHRYC